MIVCACQEGLLSFVIRWAIPSGGLYCLMVVAILCLAPLMLVYLLPGVY